MRKLNVSCRKMFKRPGNHTTTTLDNTSVSPAINAPSSSLVLRRVLLHALHDPVRVVLGILLLPLLRLQLLLHQNLLGIFSPLCTAGLSLMVFSHFLSFGNFSSETPAHSAQFTQQKQFRSAILYLP